jgi:rubrerythrin
MADILEPNNQVPSPTTPPASVSGSNNGNGVVNTGKQYEVSNGDVPEDLDMMWARWKCLVCNFTYEGANPMKKCPRCGNEDADKFEDAD